MKRRISALVLGLVMTAALAVGASAKEYTTPVTLTVINTQRPISVTVPASLPVSVVDGYVVTATNAAIRNNAAFGAVKVNAVDVLEGTYTIGNYDDFAAKVNSIALSINGCGTINAGTLSITDEAFPVVKAGDSLPISYRAKVSAGGEVQGVAAATVVFTISAVEQEAHDE